MSIAPNVILNIRSFWFGFTLPWVSLKLLIKNPKLLILGLLPCIITFFLYSYLIDRMHSSVVIWLSQILANWGFNLDGWFAYLIFFLIKIGIILLGALTFSFSSTVVASPLNDYLAEKTESLASPPLPPAPKRSWPIYLKFLLIDISRSLAATIAGLFALLLSWMPFVNFVALLITFLLFTFQFISYPQTRRNQGISESLRFLRKHLFASLGFGLITTLLFSAPLVSCLALPLIVMGGTLLFARAQIHQHPSLT